MTKHDDLDRNFVAVIPRAPQQTERSNECKVDEEQRLKPGIVAVLAQAKVQPNPSG
jgi:hypothetical protein